MLRGSAHHIQFSEIGVVNSQKRQGRSRVHSLQALDAVLNPRTALHIGPERLGITFFISPWLQQRPLLDYTEARYSSFINSIKIFNGRLPGRLPWASTRLSRRTGGLDAKNARLLALFPQPHPWHEFPPRTLSKRLRDQTGAHIQCADVEGAFQPCLPCGRHPSARSP